MLSLRMPAWAFLTTVALLVLLPSALSDIGQTAVSTLR